MVGTCGLFGEMTGGKPVGSAVTFPLSVINLFLFFLSTANKSWAFGIHTELREAKLSKRCVLKAEF